MLKYSNIKPPPSRKTGLGLHPCFPRYEILEKLGEGGVAVVYKVMDSKGGANKALKALKPEHNSSVRAVERFKDEFRILRSLHHPSLPEMFDFGYLPEGGCYMVMELVQGESLDKYLAANGDDLWILLRQIVEALEFIHEHDLLHLDFKPGNVLVRRTKAFDGTEAPLVTLIDFGLSFRRESGGEVRVVGTPEYMAPEIIGGDERITRAADYYSLGAAVYELIEGKPPFTGKVEEVLRAHISGEVAFSKEKVEYAELYPHVRALLNKDIGRRLEAFEDFRRSLLARTEEEIRSLSRAYGMGYIESLGVIGRDGLRQELRLWVEGISRELKEQLQQKPLLQASGSFEADRSKISARKQRKLNEKNSDNIFDLDEIQSSADLEKRIKEDLLSSMVMNGDEKGLHRGPAKDIARVVTLSGAEGSGKSYILGALRNECLLEGMSVFSLGDGGDYEEIVMDRNDSGPGAANPPRSVDPRSMIIDRFVNGWERLRAEGSEKGAVLVADGYDELRAEEKEFLEYVGKRLELDLGGKKDPGVFIIVSGRRPRLKKLIGGAVPAGAKAKELIVPLPANEDIDNILGEFHGHMVGADDRRRLREYLSRDTQSIGALIESLREAIAAGELERAQGTWRFIPVSSKVRKQRDTGKSYYRILYDEMKDGERELVSWLCCHYSFLDIDDFLAVSAMPVEQLDIALEKIRPYRLVDTRDEKNFIKLGISSEIVRSELYKAIDKQSRLEIHEKYRAYFETRVHELEKQAELEGSKVPKSGKRIWKPYTAASHALEQLFESMGFHLEKTGQLRSSLLMRVKALKVLKQERDVFGMRRICEESIKITRRLQGKKWTCRKWHLERYFIKEWIEAEWMVDNYRGLKEVVRKHIYTRKRELPISFVYKYGMTLSSLNHYSECQQLLKYFKKHQGSSSIYLKSVIILVEGDLLIKLGKYKNVLKLLTTMNSYKSLLRQEFQCRIELLYILCYENLGFGVKAELHIKRAYAIAKKYRDYDQLLLIYYIRITALFLRASYEQAKKQLRLALQLAHSSKVYTRLLSMYFLASAIYYEEGKYSRALNYLSKAVQMAAAIGNDDKVIDYTIRYALIFQNIGQYGNAIQYAQQSSSWLSRSSNPSLYYYSLLINFDIYIDINSTRMIKYRRLLKNSKIRIESKFHIAFYHYLMGRFYFNSHFYKKAKIELNKSIHYYQSVSFADDVFRSNVLLCYIHIETGNYKYASNILKKLSKMMNAIESSDLRAEYYIALLSFRYFTRKIRNIKYILKKCLDIQDSITNINIAMRLDIMLFRLFMRLGDLKNALKYFNKYYKKLKRLSASLPNNELRWSFINSKEHILLRNEFKSAKRNLKK